VCDSEECIAKARDERGGPGGHMLQKQRTGATLNEMDFDS
jgi:hypothetical protein